jgi:hypothetical protein
MQKSPTTADKKTHAANKTAEQTQPMPPTYSASLLLLLLSGGSHRDPARPPSPRPTLGLYPFCFRISLSPSDSAMPWVLDLQHHKAAGNRLWASVHGEDLGAANRLLRKNAGTV